LNLEATSFIHPKSLAVTIRAGLRLEERMNDLALAPKTDSTKRWNNLETHTEWNALIVSASIQNRKALLRILEGLPVDTFTAATIEQAQKVLSRHSIDAIFCEESLSDGSYRQLLETATATNKRKRFVVMLRTGEWDECLEAMRLGVTDVVRCPLHPIEVALVLIALVRDRAGQHSVIA
jgi:DNA-binding NtrC family response regulator